MIIPNKIFDVLNNKRNFDLLFLEMLRHNAPEDAYDAAIDMVREYAPKFKHYKDFDSYRVVLSNNNNKEIEVPDEIIHQLLKYTPRNTEPNEADSTKCIRVNVRSLVVEAAGNLIYDYDIHQSLGTCKLVIPLSEFTMANSGR